MKTIKIKLAIDTGNPAIVAALNTLLLTIGGTGINPQYSVKEPENAPTPIKQVKETFADPDLKQEEQGLDNTALEPTQIAPPAEKVENAPQTTIKLEQVREVLGKKVNDHRDAIKAELTKHDAKNVSVLKPEFYESFLSFLNNL